MLKITHQIYHHLRIWFDPAMEGSPYDQHNIVGRTKKTVFRFQMSKIAKQFIVR